MPRKKTQEEFVEELSITHSNLTVLGEYKGDKKYVKVRCNIHNHVFDTKPNWLHHGSNCQKCYDERRGDTLRKSIKQVLNDMNKVHRNKYKYPKLEQEYKNNKSTITIVCPIHGMFSNTVNHHLRGQGCPFCQESKLEAFIAEVLENVKIEYIREYKNKDIIGNKSVDFYIPSKKIAIECQGIQHFIPISHFGGEESFHKTYKRDNIKYNELQEQKIHTIYIIEKENLEYVPSNLDESIYSQKNLFVKEDIKNDIENFLKLLI